MGTRLAATGSTVKISSTAVALVNTYEFDTEAFVYEAANNESSGYSASTPGAKRATVRVTGELNTAAAMTILVGLQVTLLLYVDATRNYSVPITIKRFKTNADIATGSVLTYEMEAVTNGAWVEPTWA